MYGPSPHSPVENVGNQSTACGSVMPAVKWMTSSPIATFGRIFAPSAEPYSRYAAPMAATSDARATARIAHVAASNCRTRLCWATLATAWRVTKWVAGSAKPGVRV